MTFRNKRPELFLYLAATLRFIPSLPSKKKEKNWEMKKKNDPEIWDKEIAYNSARSSPTKRIRRMCRSWSPSVSCTGSTRRSTSEMRAPTMNSLEILKFRNHRNFAVRDVILNRDYSNSAYAPARSRPQFAPAPTVFHQRRNRLVGWSCLVVSFMSAR